jgi:deoxyadenosine/deoxycytidine kinase
MNNDNVNSTIAERVQEIEGEIKQIDQRDALSLIWDESDKLQEALKVRNPLITLSANISLGKSTAAKCIALYGRIKALLEPVEENPLLQLYYQNMEMYSERLQLDVINDRLFSQVVYLEQFPNQALVTDRSIYEDTLIFCQALTKSGLMKPEENEFCQDYFFMKKKQLEARYNIDLTPNLMIILEGRADTGWERAVGRKRQMEMREDSGKGVGLSREFYDALHQEYQEFPQRLKKHYNRALLVLPQDEVEVADASNAKGLLYVVRSVKEAIRISNGSK